MCHDHPASDAIQHFTQDFIKAWRGSNIPGSDAVDRGGAEITVWPEQAAPHLTWLTTLVDRNNG